MRSRPVPLACLLAAIALCGTPARATAQGSAPRRTVQATIGGGLLTSGAYFTGPGDLALDNSDAFAGMVQVIVPVNRSFGLVAGGAYARPDWRLSGVPVFGTIGVDGASLWFADAGVRGQLPLSRGPGQGAATSGPVAFAQVGAGLAHYALTTAVLGRAVDESATNFAVALGAGIGVPLGGRIGLELMAKDYIVSFKSVRDLAALGVEGRRAHTLLVTASARVGL
jgi:hypothetical protein